MRKRLSWAASLAAVATLALLIDLNSGPPSSARALMAAGSSGVDNGDFTAAPAGAPPGAPPPGAMPPGGFAGAATQGGFQRPNQPMDLGAVTVLNAVPDGCKLLNMRQLSGFSYDGDYKTMLSPFDKPTKIKHPRRKIPAAVKALDGKEVAVCGFMLPFDYVKSGTADFALLKSQAGCCFGTAPRLNEWIEVHMPKATEVIMDTPILVRGRLKVKEIREAGNLMGIYSMDGEAVELARIGEADR